MGIILLPYFLVAFVLVIVQLIKAIVNIAISKDYKILFHGFLGALFEIIFILFILLVQGNVYAFSPVFGFLWILIINSVASFLLSFDSNAKLKRLSSVLSVTTCVLFILLILHYFVFSQYISIFDKLGINVYY